MSYLIRQGFTDKYTPVDRSQVLPGFERVTIDGPGADWGATTYNLGSLATAAQVLLAGYAAGRIKYGVDETLCPNPSALVKGAWHKLGGYIEEYGTDDPRKRDARATQWLGEMYAYVEANLRAQWVSVEALAQALLQQGTLSEAQAGEIIGRGLPANLQARAKVLVSQTPEERRAAALEALHQPGLSRSVCRGAGRCGVYGQNFGAHGDGGGL